MSAGGTATQGLSDTQGSVNAQSWAPPHDFAEYDTIQVRRVAGALGAEISGVDLAEPLSDAVIADIRAALLEHLVIFFRGQGHITPADQAAFARRFGDLVDYPMMKGLEEEPHVAAVVKNPDERVNFGGIWHSDTTYLQEPPLGSVLLARELPPFGGDTEFANMYVAYETLSTPLRAFLDGLTVLNSSAKGAAHATRAAKLDGSAPPAPLEAEHPAVRTHPETGRKALFLNVGHSVKFKELTQAESDPLLSFLFAHQSQPDFTCRFQWTEGAVAFWDNRAAMHYPVNDYHGFKRVMHRVTIAGDGPR